MSARVGFIAETVSFIVGIPAILLGGWLSDRIGRRPVNIWGNLLFLVAIYPVFAWIVAERSQAVLILGMSILSIASNLNTASFYAGLVESLPATLRGAGFGGMYAVSVAAFGGTTQLVITWLIHITASAMAPAWYLTGATAIGQIGVLLMPESAPARIGNMAAGVLEVAGVSSKQV
jgi:MFS family permease